MFLRRLVKRNIFSDFTLNMIPIRILTDVKPYCPSWAKFLDNLALSIILHMLWQFYTYALMMAIARLSEILTWLSNMAYFATLQVKKHKNFTLRCKSYAYLTALNSARKCFTKTFVLQTAWSSKRKFSLKSELIWIALLTTFAGSELKHNFRTALTKLHFYTFVQTNCNKSFSPLYNFLN